MLAQCGDDLGTESVQHRPLVGAGGGGQKDEVARARIVETLQLGRHFACGARGGDAVDHGPEVLIVSAAHRAGGFIACDVAVRVDVEEHPHTPMEAGEVATGIDGGLPDRGDGAGVPAGRVHVWKPAVAE